MRSKTKQNKIHLQRTLKDFCFAFIKTSSASFGFKCFQLVFSFYFMPLSTGLLHLRRPGVLKLYHTQNTWHHRLISPSLNSLKCTAVHMYVVRPTCDEKLRSDGGTKAQMPLVQCRLCCQNTALFWALFLVTSATVAWKLLSEGGFENLAMLLLG